jgi:hypothetical protein
MFFRNPISVSLRAEPRWPKCLTAAHWTSTNFRAMGSNQSRQQGGMLQGTINARAGPVVYVPCDCARTRQHEHRLVHALGEVHAYIFVKRFVQSAPHQNKLNLLLAFREHDNVLSLFLCCITDITTHRQFVINDQKHIFENTSC